MKQIWGGHSSTEGQSSCIYGEPSFTQAKLDSGDAMLTPGLPFRSRTVNGISSHSGGGAHLTNPLPREEEAPLHV